MDSNRLTIKNISNPNNSETITIEFPRNSICPVCQTACNNNVIDGFFNKGQHYYFIYLRRVCYQCGEVTFYKYTLSPSTVHNYIKVDLCDYCYSEYPENETTSSFAEEIEKISPRFVDIYQQSEKAEKLNFHEICGMGYRKCLEFLVKDYLIQANPDIKDTIEKEPLQSSIRRIDDNKIKLLAERSAWLGNDECHYIKKHENYNVSDLKLFISAIINFIESELIFQKATLIEHK